MLPGKRPIFEKNIFQGVSLGNFEQLEWGAIPISHYFHYFLCGVIRDFSPKSQNTQGSPLVV